MEAVEIPASFAEVNTEIILMLYAQKGSRDGVFKQSITILPGIRPAVRIELVSFYHSMI